MPSAVPLTLALVERVCTSQFSADPIGNILNEGHVNAFATRFSEALLSALHEERGTEDSSVEKRAPSKEKTAVVRLRRKGGVVVQDCDVYIGRRLYMGGWRLPASEWANPFSVKDCGGDPVLACKKFEQYLLDERPDLVARLGELRGKVLGCWCKPHPCHGDVLVHLANRYADE